MLRKPDGDDLRRMRLAANRSTEEMAKKIDKSRVTYEKYESGETKIGHIDALTLCIYCNLDISPFLNQFTELENRFSQYKGKDDDKKPNSRDSSKKKNPHKQFPEEQQETATDP